MDVKSTLLVRTELRGLVAQLHWQMMTWQKKPLEDLAKWCLGFWEYYVAWYQGFHEQE